MQSFLYMCVCVHAVASWSSAATSIFKITGECAMRHLLKRSVHCLSWSNSLETLGSLDYREDCVVCKFSGILLNSCPKDTHIPFQ